jgi:vitamin B12 transporter
MRNKYVVYLNPKKLVLLLTIAIGTFSYAKSQPLDSKPLHSDTLENISLREVEVNALENLRVQTSPVPFQLLKGAHLEKMNSLSVADAVRYFSGVQLKDYGGIGGLKTINVRSLGTNHTAVFYDGIAVSNAQNGQVDLGKFSLSNMEEISLYNGQNPALLQPARSYASASSVYLTSKAPVFEDRIPFNASLKLKSGSFGLVNPALDIDYRLNNKIYTRLSTEFTNADGHYKFRYTNGVYDTTAIRKNADITAFRLEATVFGRPDSNSSWTAKYYHYHSERGLPGAIVSNRFDYSQRLWDESNFLQIDFNRKVAAFYKVAVKAKYTADYNRYLDPEYVSTDGFLDNKYKQNEAYASLANEFQLLPFWKINLSADYIYNTLDANLYRFPYPTRNTFLAVLATDFKFGSINIQGSLLATLINESVEIYEAGSGKEEYTPTVMLNWKPFPANDLRLRAFYKSVFRMPTFNDLYYTFIGNSFLRPEYTDQYNVGLTYFKLLKGTVFNFLSVQSDVYYNSVRDKIVAMPSSNLFRWTMVNLDEVRIKGLEVNVKANGSLSKKLSFSGLLNYTYQQATDVTPDAYNYKHQIPYIPLHSGSFTASVDADSFGANYSFIYTGERYNQKTNIPVNYVEPWYTHDISAWYSFKICDYPVTLRSEVNNLFNQYYDVILNFPMPGRHYRFTLSVNI